MIETNILMMLLDSGFNRTIGLSSAGLATLAGDAVEAFPDVSYPRSFLIERTKLGIFLGGKTTDFVLCRQFSLHTDTAQNEASIVFLPYADRF
jgi:hypothetical protein